MLPVQQLLNELQSKQEQVRRLGSDATWLSLYPPAQGFPSSG